MTQPKNTPIQCRNCGQQVPMQIRQIIDAQNDPEGKSLLLAEQLNTAQCPYCGAVNKVFTPILYHDAEKELLVALVPMEVGAQRQESDEKIIGDLMNTLTRDIPKENFKAYMFNPKRALTMQGLINQILEADGIDPEVIEDQRRRVDLIQKMMSSSSMEALDTIIEDNDEQIDETFFQTLSLMARRMMEDQRQDIAGGLMSLQNHLLEKSTYGRELAQQQEVQENVIREVAEAIEDLGEDAHRSDFIELAIEYADDQDRLQALVGLVRPVFDYQFFEEFTQYISKAPGDERERLEAVRQQLVELTQQIDQQMQQKMRQAANFLQEVVNSQDPATVLRSNPQRLDDDFMSVLSANIQEAEKRGDQAASSRLQEIYQIVVQLLQSQMSPELRFLNELLTIESEDQMREQARSRAQDYDAQPLLETLDAVEQVLRQQGHTAVLQRLGVIREEFKAVLN